RIPDEVNRANKGRALTSMPECLVRGAIAEVFRVDKLDPGRFDDLIAADVNGNDRRDGGGDFHHFEQLKPERGAQSRGYRFLGLSGCLISLLNVQHEMQDIVRSPLCYFVLMAVYVGY